MPHVKSGNKGYDKLRLRESDQGSGRNERTRRRASRNPGGRGPLYPVQRFREFGQMAEDAENAGYQRLAADIREISDYYDGDSERVKRFPKSPR